MSIIVENKVKIEAKIPNKIHSKMEVFFNPQMESNRNISILLLNCIPNQKMNLALPLAGSGVRGIRFLKELKKGKIEKIFINDQKEGFISTLNNNLKRNDLDDSQLLIGQEEANTFLMNQHKDDFCGYFDYIDLDPFGSPNPFLSSAIARIKRKGILAITATDTAALTGTYLKTTKRKYWANSLKNYLMHETGLRILIRKVQLLGVQFEKALTPILSYHKDHYFRVYFVSNRGKGKCDEIIKQHQYLLYCNKCLDFKKSRFNYGRCACDDFGFAGPLWVGNLFDQELVKKMAKNNKFLNEQKFLDLLKDEKDLFGFYDLHVVSEKYKVKTPKLDGFLKEINGSRTHFSRYGIKSEKGIKEILKKIK